MPARFPMNADAPRLLTFTDRVSHALLRSSRTAASRTLATTGSALIGSALTTALGFGVLAFSPLTPFQQFDMLTAITMAFTR